MLIFALLACATSPDEGRRAPAAPPLSEAAAEVFTVDPAELRYDEAAGLAIWSPNSRVQSATYSVYELELASLLAVTGGRPTAPVALRLSLGPPDVRTETPADPTLPAPAGGFVITTRRGRVLGLAGAP